MHSTVITEPGMRDLGDNRIFLLYDNQIKECPLIGQSAMVYCADKLMGKSRVF